LAKDNQSSGRVSLIFDDTGLKKATDFSDCICNFHGSNIVVHFSRQREPLYNAVPAKNQITMIGRKKIFLRYSAVLMVFLLGEGAALFAQIPRNGLDVKHYDFSITLQDSSNLVEGKAIITIWFTGDEKKVVLDLAGKNKDGTGMTVRSVTKNGTALRFEQDSQHLFIDDAVRRGTENIYTITWEGVPADGLVISNTRHGRRSFFADNWPNRAHNWIPCNDHLSDKATVEFRVTAPDHYKVISNGRLAEETPLPLHQKLTHWVETVPLPTKVMVIGVTDFAVSNLGNVDCIPVSSWVFPEDRDSGFTHYKIAKDILRWYISRIGPYAYEKLANVQSKTIFGGMENAGCIFYSENSVNSRTVEELFAHEIAHQWFGDNATEKDWPHLWLSEGFATYMTDLYFENKYGKDTLRSMLELQRDQVIRFYAHHKTPVVDTTAKNNLMHLLNANSYQKGAWVLHMLRRKLGDSLFWKGIRLYYKTYSGSNAATGDLESIFEKVSHQDLATFFRQWLFGTGQPELHIEWSYDSKKKEVALKIEQTQKDLFEFPLQIGFTYGNTNIVRTIDIKDRLTKKEIPLAGKPAEVRVDPYVNLLFTSAVKAL
jgi:aminopeptidase N